MYDFICMKSIVIFLMDIYFRSTQKGKGKAADAIPIKFKTPKKESEEDKLSEDWDESEMELAFKKSTYVYFHIFCENIQLSI